MKHQLAPGVLNKDLSPNKYPNDKLFELRNFRIIANDSQKALSISNEKGTKFVCTIPQIFNLSTSSTTGLFNVKINGQTIQTLNYTLSELFSLPNITNAKIADFVEIRDEL